MFAPISFQVYNIRSYLLLINCTVSTIVVKKEKTSVCFGFVSVTKRTLFFTSLLLINEIILQVVHCYIHTCGFFFYSEKLSELMFMMMTDPVYKHIQV